MKTIKVNWWCRLFGHKFVTDSDSCNYCHTKQYRNLDYCIGCGLTKDEIRDESKPGRPPHKWDKELDKAADEVKEILDQEEIEDKKQ